jgi:hypothetical protein
MSFQSKTSWIGLILQSALFILLPFLILGFLPEIAGIFNVSKPERWIKCFFGGTGFIVVRLLLIRFKPSIWYFIMTFEHELTHLLAGLLTGKYPKQFWVNSEDGSGFVLLSGGNMCISLAPYFVPTLPLLVLLVGLFVDARYEAMLLYIYGSSLVYHALSTWNECHRHQTDIIKVGYAKSITVLTVANLLLVSSLLMFVGNGYNGFASYWHQGSKRTVNSIFFAGELTLNFVSKSLTDKPLASEKKEGIRIESNLKKK